MTRLGWMPATVIDDGTVSVEFLEVTVCAGVSADADNARCADVSADAENARCEFGKAGRVWLSPFPVAVSDDSDDTPLV